jgi:DNA invertase Pin-like site-specific DNA recombinase
MKYAVTTGKGKTMNFGYVRVSTARQAGEGESLDVQRRQLEGYAIMHGLALDEIAMEEGVSGSIPLHQRPKGAALLARLQPGDAVVAPKLDRLFRSALDALQVVENLRARGVSLHLLDLGGDISGNGLSKLFLTIAAAFAEAERDRIRERVAGAKADQKARNRFLGGNRPFGFKIVRTPGERGAALEPDESEQRAIKSMVRQRKRGATLREIAAALAKRGHRLSPVGVANVLDEVGVPRAKAAPGTAARPTS